MNARKSALLILIPVISIFSGCNAFKPVSFPEPLPIPADFAGKKDTSSVAEIAPNVFFNNLTLVSLIQEALNNNKDVLIAAERIQMARAFLKMKRGDLIPTLDLGSGAGIEKFGDYTMEGVGNFDTNLSPNINEKQRVAQPYVPNLLLGINTSWEIDIWGKFRNRKRAAKAKLLASEYGKRALETSITALVASLYYELEALDAELEIIQKNINLQQKALDVVKARKEAGREDQLAVERFIGQLLNTKALEPAIKQDIIQLENQLNVLLGRFPKPISRNGNLLTDTIPINPEIGIPSEWLKNRPDIMQAERELAAAGYEVKSARAEFFPALRISLNLGLNSFSAGTLFDVPASLAFGLIGGITGPLLNRAQIQGNFNKTAAENRMAFQEYEKKIITGYSEVMTHLQHAQLLADREKLKMEEVEVMKRAVIISENLMSSGYASYLDVVTAQKTVLDAELESVIIRKNRFINLVNLYTSLGGGWQR